MSSTGCSMHDVRCAHYPARESLSVSCLEEEFLGELPRVTKCKTNVDLAKVHDPGSKSVLSWTEEQGVRWQPSSGGLLSLGRTHSFFFRSGHAMLNALYRTAEKVGVTAYIGEKRIMARALAAAARGFESNIDWLQRYWRAAAHNLLIDGIHNNKRSNPSNTARQRRAVNRRPNRYCMEASENNELNICATAHTLIEA